MFGGFALVVVLVLVLVVALAAVSAVVFGRRRARSLVFDEDRYPGLARLRAATLASRWVGLVLGALVVVAAFPLGLMGRFALAGPPVAGGVAVLAVLIGQRAVHGAAQSPGTAGIERRRPLDYLSRGQTAGVAVALAALVVAAGWTTAIAGPDSLGTPGRAITAAWTEYQYFDGASHDIPMTETRSPFPGSFYTVPLGVGVLVLIGLTAVALVTIARRPRSGADPELVRVDDALRRIAAEGVLAAAGLGLGLGLFGLATLGYLQLGQLAQVPGYLVGCYLLAACSFTALVYLVRSLLRFAIPGDGSRP